MEPISELTLRDLTRKALFLVSLATAKRVGEIQALTAKVTWRGKDMVLYFNPSFLAKTESITNPLKRLVEVKALPSISRSEGSKSLCPVRTLSHYLNRIREMGIKPKSLFVSPKVNSKPITKNAVSYFIRSIILEAKATIDDNLGKPRAHSVRGVATSIAFTKNIPLKTILEAASWKSSSVFSKFYFNDISSSLETCKDSFVSAGSIITP